MIKISGVLLTFYIIIAVILLSVFMAIIIYAPFYSGFESELNYLSPDLSENRTLIRDSIVLDKASKIKIVFESKDSNIKYSEEDFSNFLEDLEVEIWNDNEYFAFHNKNIEFFNNESLTTEITIGNINGNGKYFIYINSNFAVNPVYHIGIGIGREGKFSHFGNNRRNFY